MLRRAVSYIKRHTKRAGVSAIAAVSPVSSVPPGPVIGKVHALEDNYALTLDQHRKSVEATARIQQLYDGSVAYLDNKGLDKSLFLPGNEWETIIPVSGMKFRDTYNDINHIRLIGPFSGFHMCILDRMDEVRFPAAWTTPFVHRLVVQGIPADIAKEVRSLYDPGERLRPCLPDYIEHVTNIPSRYVVRTPRMFGEMGIEVDGVLANPDVILCQSRINGLLCSGVLDKLDDDIARRGKARVLEIGSGHGGLAYALKSIFGDKLEYICVDLPSSVYHGTVYLGNLANWEDCHVHMPGDTVPRNFNYIFAANYCCDELADGLGDGTVDLALNAMSFSEMTVEQVRYYGELFKKLLRPDGVAFDENASPRPHHTDNKKVFSEIFGYRKHVSSDVIKTKNWCQDVWASRYIGKIFDAGDVMLLRD